MKVKIYAYDNSILEAEVPVKTVEQIKSIYVHIVSSDEIVTFTTIDGKQVMFDAVKAIGGGGLCALTTGATL